MALERVRHELPAPESVERRQSLIADVQDAQRMLQALVGRMQDEQTSARPLLRLVGRDDEPQHSASEHPSMVLRCFGDIRLEVDGRPLPLKLVGKPAALLKFLATRGCVPTQRDLIIEALWADGEVEVAVRRFRVALHELRRLLKTVVDPDEVLTYRHGCLALGASGHLRLDVDEFEANWQRGARLEREKGLAAAIPAYRQANDLYGGDFMAQDAYEEWTLMRREALRDAHLEMLGKLAAWAFDEGDYSECKALCQRLVQADPCREDAYRLLIRSHLATGQPARAQRWFDLCCAALRRELELEPSSETRALVAHLFAA